MNNLPYLIKKIFKIPYAKYYFEKEILSTNKKCAKLIQTKSELKNILHLNTYTGTGGAAKIAYNALCGELQKKDYNCDILVDRFFEDEKPQNVYLIDKILTKDQKILYRAQGELSWLDFFHQSSFNIKNMNIFKNADVLHLHNLHGNFFNLFALPEITSLKPTIWTLHDQFAMTGHCASPCECENWLTGCKVCSSLSSVPVISTDTANFLYETKKNIYKNCDFTVVANSKWMKKNIEKSILKDHEIKLIPNGVDTDIFKPYDKREVRKKLDLPLDKKILMFSSNLGLDNTQKGTKYLLDAYEYFKNRDDILFISVGGERREYLYENFICFPYITSEKEMAEFYTAADLFIFPTLAETFGLVIAEALSCEIPVITFDTGPIPELVEHMQNGYLAKYKNSSDFIKGIELFLEKDDLLYGASKKARNKIVENFSLIKMVDEYEKLYHEAFKND
jgi:glycosyltransferase involved in cell wall biosynthesis